MERKIEELREAPHWSYSALNTYLNLCPLMFRFKYMEHAPIERTSSCFPFGRAYHAALSAQAEKAKNGNSLSDNEIMEVFAEYLSAEVNAIENLVYKTNETYDSLLETGFRMLHEALVSWQDYYTIRSIAEGFSIEVPGLSAPLIGEFDLVVEEGHDPCIVDWKTSAQKWAYGKANRDFQATVFSYAYYQRYRTLPLFRFDVVTKTKTPSLESHYTQRNQDSFERFEYLANEVENAVKKGVFPPAETCFSCVDCPYADRCKTVHRISITHSIQNGGTNKANPVFEMKDRIPD